MRKLTAPNGSNVSFRSLGQDRFEVALAGLRPSVLAKAIFATRRGMATDAKIPGETEETPWSKVVGLAREAGLEGEKMSEFERALTMLCEHAEAGTARGDDESENENVNIEVEEGEDEIELEEGEDQIEEEGENRRPAHWAADPRERLKRWNAVDRFLRRKGAGDKDLSELRAEWQRHWGALPKTALNNPMGNAASDRKRARDRRQAMDRWGDDAARLDPRSGLETMYGVRQQALRREPIPQASLDRWPDAARIG